ncbi:alpha/beta fold hydrolase [Pseudarthrobacter sp. J1763]|uniref:alpha/beta fold hydrolase n=1 Tax=Pseudarthrobacter sp. J1763 TaxID=3420445 RepID=UPI003D26B4C4
MVEHVTSSDGTSIAFEAAGSGDPLLIIGGALSNRHAVQPYVPFLQDTFTVYGLDRRGRGESTDTQPYAVDREIEDIAAVVQAIDGNVAVYGHSSGAILALEAAAAGVPFGGVFAYEPPYCTPQDPDEPWDAFAQRVQQLVENDQRDQAVQAFMAHVGAPTDPDMVNAPWWPQLTAIAHTLFYDLHIVGDAVVPQERLARIKAPVLVVHGGSSPAWAQQSAREVAAAVQHGSTAELEDQTHNADPAALAPLLLEFLASNKHSKAKH